jgi:hypothetical protein
MRRIAQAVADRSTIGPGKNRTVESYRDFSYTSRDQRSLGFRAAQRMEMGGACMDAPVSSLGDGMPTVAGADNETGPARASARGVAAAEVPVVTGRRWVRPLDALAGLGLAFVVYQVWGIVAWLASDGFRARPAVAVPGRMHNLAVESQLGMQIVAAGWLVYLVVDLVRRRTLTWPLLVTAVWTLTYWQESLANVTGGRFAYNSAYFERGDWTPHMPFVPAGGSTLPPPLGLEPFVFFAVLPILAFAGAAALRGVRRFTRVRSPWVLAGIGYAGFMALDFLIEQRSIGQGMHSYPLVYGPLSIRDGSPRQFPMYETVLLGLMWALPAIVLFTLRDIPTSGSAPAPPRWRQGPVGALLTVLAAVAAMNVVFLVYNLIAFVWLPGNTPAQMPPWLTP